MTTHNFPPKDQLTWDVDADYPIPPKDIIISSNGAGYAKGHKGLIYGPGTFAIDPQAFTPETSIEAIERKEELKELRLRHAIETMTGEELEQAFGTAGARLWQEIVLNPDAPGRTRKDVWLSIGEEAGIISKKKGGGGNSGASIKLDGLTPELAKELRLLIEATKEG